MTTLTLQKKPVFEGSENKEVHMKISGGIQSKTVKEKPRQKLGDKPLTLRRVWMMRALCASPLVLLAGVAIADREMGGAIAMQAVDAGMAAVQTIDPDMSAEDAVEWGVTLSRPLKFLMTDTDGLLVKNESALMAKNQHPDDMAAVRDAVFPVIMSVDSRMLLTRHATRSAIVLRNYPDMDTNERGVFLAEALVNDILQSYQAASELQDVPVSNIDIVNLLLENESVFSEAQPELQAGLVSIKEAHEAAYAAEEAARIASQPPELIDYNGMMLEQWQIDALEASLEAEGAVAPTEDDFARMDREMDRVMQEFEEANRPRTIEEIRAEQQAARAQQGRTDDHAADKARNTTREIAGHVQSRAAAAVPSRADVAYCTMTNLISDESYARCLRNAM